MAEILLYLFIGICISSLIWGLIRIERIYQYPFFMGVIFISFVVPQAFALNNNPLQVSFVALERVYLMSCFCAVMCWLGYNCKANSQCLSILNISIDEKKLSQAGLVLMLMGYLFNFLISNMNKQIAVNGNWTGSATIYYFFAQVIYIAFTIFLLQALKRPKFINILLVLISSYPILQAIILYGRRQPTMTFLIIVGFAFWLVRRYVLPRWIFIIATIIGAYLIPLLGDLRGDFWNLLFSQDWDALLYSSQKSFNSLLEGDILELRNAALVMDAADRTNKFGFGTGFWDDIIFQYVPGQIVGFDFKESLQFNIGAYDDLGELYGYKVHNGTTFTGIGDSFVEFSYFGCLMFAIIGYIFKNLWISSVYQNSIVSRLLYMGLISPAMVGISHGIGRFFQEAIFQLIFIFIVYLYARSKPQHNYINKISYISPD